MRVLFYMFVSIAQPSVSSFQDEKTRAHIQDQTGDHSAIAPTVISHNLKFLKFGFDITEYYKLPQIRFYTDSEIINILIIYKKIVRNQYN